GGLPPGGDGEDALVALALAAQVTPVEVHADRAAVDLAGPQRDEVEDDRGDPGLGSRLGQALEGLHGAGDGDGGGGGSCVPRDHLWSHRSDSLRHCYDGSDGGNVTDGPK